MVNNNENNTDIEDNGWGDGNNRVKRQVMLANDLKEQKRDSDLRRKNDNDGWMNGNNRVKTQVMIANDLTEQKRDSDLRRKNLKLVKNKLYIPDDDQDESVTPPCNICTGTLLNILCQTCGKPSNFK